MKLLNLQSENLVVDWICFNIQGLADLRRIADGLFKYFTPHALIDNVARIGYYGLNKKYKISIREYTGFKGYWVGTLINFSGENAAYLYSFIKEHQFDWNLLELQTISLGRLDLHYFRQFKPTDSNQQVKDFMQASCDSVRAKSKRRQVQFDPNKKPS